MSLKPEVGDKGILPVVVIKPPISGNVVVVEIAYFMEYLNSAEKKLASEFFEENTMLSCESTYCKNISNC